MIHVECSTEPAPVALALIEAAASAVLVHEALDGELTVVMTDDAQIRKLNREYLGIDAPTDVLAFPAGEIDPENGAAYLGDVIVSVPRAAEQARDAGHPVADELQLLVVHGTLHLLGHDHASAADKSRMWAAQAEVLKRIGLPTIEIRES